MSNEHQLNQESTFIQHLNQMVHDQTMVYYRNREKYPIDNDVIQANTFYAKILFDIAFNTEPTLDQFASLEFRESPEMVYQGALYLYYVWKNRGLIGAADSYCRHINNVVERSAAAKAPGETTLLPDFSCSKGEVVEQLLRMSNKQPCKN